MPSCLIGGKKEKTVNFSSFNYTYGREITTYKLGGRLRAFSPENEYELIEAVDFLKKTGNDFTVVGGGSKILFPDEDTDRFIIKTDKLKGIFIKGNKVTFGAGVTVPEAIRFCLYNGLTGIEYLVKIPALMGGVAAMNAGVSGKNFSDTVKYVTVLRNGVVTAVFPEKSCYSEPFISDGDEVLSATCVVEPAPEKKIKENLLYYINRRKNQPFGRSCGSVFINPEGDFSGRLIEEAGLKGTRIGGAYVSDIHANFIVADGVKSGDVKKLIDVCYETVSERFGIELKKEVKIIGD